MSEGQPSSGVTGATAPEGVSGSASVLPDQDCADLVSATAGPNRQSCTTARPKNLKLRFSLPPKPYAFWADLSPKERGRVAAAILGAVDSNIDPKALLATVEELRRAGILLNQALRYAHKGDVPGDFVQHVKAVLQTIQKLKP